MAFRKFVVSVFLTAGAGLLAACASNPASAPQPAAQAPAAPATAAKPAPGSSPEADTASLTEKKFQEAARSYRQVQKDGKTLYCKKEKPMGSTIPKNICITESQLRLEVEQMEDTRQRMRNSSRCTTGAGCGAGG
jgi:hypothetical protein